MLDAVKGQVQDGATRKRYQDEVVIEPRVWRSRGKEVGAKK